MKRVDSSWNCAIQNGIFGLNGMLRWCAMAFFGAFGLLCLLHCDDGGCLQVQSRRDPEWDLLFLDNA
jgi:hypothetical protein